MSDKKVQEFWDELVDSSIRVGIAEGDDDSINPSKAFLEHIDRMLEKEVMDARMAIIYDQLVKHDYIGLSELESTWLITIGDFMLRNGKFNIAREGDWYNAMLFVTVTIKARMEEEGVE